MKLSDAIAQVSAPGEIFETRTRGMLREFVHAPESLRDLVDAARGDPRPFLLFGEEEWSFARVVEGADALSTYLVSELGLRRGDRVAIAMRNRPEWVVTLAAVTQVSLVLVALNPWWSEEDLSDAISDADPRALIVGEELSEFARRLTESHSLTVIRVVRESTPSGPASFGVDFHELLRGPVGNLEPRPRRDDVATMLFTSGTTGRSKGAVSTHGAITQALLAFSAGLVIESVRSNETDSPSETVPILLVPLFHVTGLIPVLLSSIAWKFRLVVASHWDPGEVLALIARHGVTHVIGVPTQIYDLLHAPGSERTDLSSVRRLGGGGAPAPVDLVNQVEERLEGGRSFLGYGLTETNAYGPQNYAEDYVRRPGSTGQVPTIVMDVEIRDDKGRRCAVGEVGESWVHGPTLARGYWRRDEETRAAFVEGWFRTGDLGYLDDEDFLYVVDRVKDVIIRAGENVYCAQVEAVLSRHPKVVTSVVVGLEDERLGQRVGALVVVRATDRVSEEEIREFATRHLARYQVPSDIVISASPVPVTATGKVKKDLVRSIYF